MSWMGGRTQVRNYSTGSVALEFARDGIARAKFVGVLTSGVSRAVLAECQAGLEECGSVALVADCSQTHLTLGLAELAAAVRSTIFADGGSVRPGGLIVPTAIIVQRERLEDWSIYADICARYGIVREAFTDCESALRWAAEKGPVLRAWLRERARSRAETP